VPSEGCASPARPSGSGLTRVMEKPAAARKGLGLGRSAPRKGGRMVRPFKGQALVRPGGQVMYLDLAPGERRTLEVERSEDALLAVLEGTLVLGFWGRALRLRAGRTVRVGPGKLRLEAPEGGRALWIVLGVSENQLARDHEELLALLEALPRSRRGPHREAPGPHRPGGGPLLPYPEPGKPSGAPPGAPAPPGTSGRAPKRPPRGPGGERGGGAPEDRPPRPQRSGAKGLVGEDPHPGLPEEVGSGREAPVAAPR
jgi:hypothetical protein